MASASAIPPPGTPGLTPAGKRTSSGSTPAPAPDTKPVAAGPSAPIGWKGSSERKHAPKIGSPPPVISPEDLAQSKVRTLISRPDSLVAALVAEPQNELLWKTAMDAIGKQADLTPFANAATQDPAAAPMRVALATELAARTAKGLGPPTLTSSVAVRAGSIAATAVSGLKASLGPGDAKALERFTQAHAPDLARLDQAAQGSAPSTAPLLSFAAQALKPPGGRVDLVLCNDAPSKTFGAEPVMVLTTTAKGELQLYAVPNTFPRAGLQDALSNSKLADRFSAAWRAAWPNEPAPTRANVLPNFADDEHLAKTIAAMPAADRDALFHAMSPKGTLGGLAVPVRPTSVPYASVEAGTGNVRTSVDGVPGLDRLANFARANGDTLFAPTFLQFAQRGEPEKVSGADVDNLLGMAMHLPMKKAMADDSYAPKEGESLFDGSSLKSIAPVAEQVRRIAASRGAGAPAEVTLLPVMLTTPDERVLEVPLFKVKGAAGDEYVDTAGRRYSSLESWTKTNELPPGVMTFPKGGAFHVEGGINVATQTLNTPKTIDTTMKRAGVAADKAVQVGGIVVGAAVLVGTGGTAALVASGALAAYGAVQSGSELADRAAHGQSISLTNADARQSWYGVGSSALMFTGMGAAGLVGVSRSAATVASASFVASNVVDAAGIVEAGVGAAKRLDRMTAQDAVSIAANLAMYGVMAHAAGGPRTMYNFRELRTQLLAGARPA